MYVDFWASWCGPCRARFPWMNEMQQKYGGKGFAVVGDQRRQEARATPTGSSAQNSAEFTVVFDEAGTTPAAYGGEGHAELLSRSTRKGNVACVERGFQDEHKAELEQRIARLAAR